MGDFGGCARFDRHFGQSVPEREVDRGRGRGDIEGHPVVLRRERLQIGADLVADVACGRRAVGADDAEIDLADLHQMAAGVIDDDRMGDTVLAEFPRRQCSALVARPRLVDPDMHGDAGIMRLVDGRGGGAPVDGREPAGIAMGENIDRLAGGLARRRGADEGEAVIADRRTERDILVCDASGAGQGCRRAFAEPAAA